MADKFQKEIALKATGAEQVKSKIDGVKASADKVGQSADKMNGSFAGFIKTAVGIGAVVAGVKKLGDAAIKTAEAAMEEERIFRKLETAVNLAGVSYKDNKKELDALIATQQQYTEFGDTDTAGMLTQLIQLSGDYGASMRGLVVAQDLAASGMFDAASAARYVGMALAGNVTMLGRYIPELKESNPELKALKTNAERSAYALELLEKKFGGTARENINTTAGAIAQLKNYAGDLQEELGFRLTPTITKGAKALTEFFQRATETSLETTIRQLEKMGAAAEDIAELQKISTLTNSISEIDKATKSLARGMQNVKLPDTLIKQFGAVEILVRDMDEVGAVTSKNIIIGKDYDNVLAGVNSAMKTLSNEATSLTREYADLKSREDELTKAERKRLKAVIDLSEQNTQYYNVLVDYRTQLANIIDAEANLNKIKNESSELLSDVTVEMTEQEIAAALLASEIQKLGEKYKWTEADIGSFVDELKKTSEIMSGGLLSMTAPDFRFEINIDAEKIKRQITGIESLVESGKMPEIKVTPILEKLNEDLIRETVVLPLEEIPESDRIIEVDLRTDFQKYIDNYSDTMNTVSDIARGASQVYSNIIESRYNKELDLMRKSTAYLKSDYDKRRIMEEDLQASYADERIKAFRFNQVASAGEAAINTAVAASKYVGNPLMLAATLALGAIQQASIWSQPVPTYAEGGLLPYSGGASLFVANERGRESVLNAQTTAWLGADGVRALNEGRSVETNYVNNLVVNLNGDIYGQDTVVREIAEKIEELSNYGFTRISVKQ